MKVRWIIVFFPVVSVIVLSLAVMHHNARAASPQGAGTAPATATAPAATPSIAGDTAIPTTTLAINSDKPMSERIVHYEIDAKYNAEKHVVDATEVLTYHNVT